MLQVVQSFANDTLDWVMIGASMIGDEMFYMAVLPILYFAVDKRLGIRIGMVMLVSLFANLALKWGFASPRPIGVEGIRSLYVESAPGYSFPSGHSQGAATFWGYLATVVRKKWFALLALVIVLMVMISRLYLGVHWPIDVVGGLVFGATCVALGHWVDLKLSQRRMSFPLHLLIGVAVPLAMLAFYHEQEGRLMIGFLIGAWVGYSCESRYVEMTLPKNIWQRILPVVVGLLSVFLWRTMLQGVLPQDAPWDLVRYAMIGMWATFVFPWILVQLGVYKSARKG